MDKTEWTRLRYQELIDLRSLLKQQNKLLGASLRQSEDLAFLHKTINLLSLKEISSVLVNRLPSILSIHYFTLFLYDKDKRKLSLLCHNHPEIEGTLSLFLADSPIMEDAVLRGHYILEQVFNKSRYYKGLDNLLFERGFFVTIPLMIENETVGVLNINDGEGELFNVSDLGFSLKIAEFISLSISNAVLYEKTEKLAVTDGLTSIANRPSMDRSLWSEFERSIRYRIPLSVVLFDIDHFKAVNDNYGHQKGDEILVTVASILKKFCRANDVAARYGGEEFLMILPQSTSQGAFKIAERVRKEMMKISFVEDNSNFGVTVSCGVAELDTELMKNTDQLVEVADQALYEAKNSGRNKTIVGQAKK